MKNPGSANFKNANHQPIENESILDNLACFDNSKDSWYEFNRDTTMDCVAELFASYYNTPKQELNGIIQIFNLFYIRDANLGTALTKSKNINCFHPFENEEAITSYDIEHLIPPIYLGFGGLAWDSKYSQRAMMFYNATISTEYGAKYLSNKFKDNAFFHPLYLMRLGKNRNNRCIADIAKFKQNLRDENCQKSLATEKQ
jgi:hypothetical protein